MQACDEILQTLTPRTAADWLAVADVLARLEAISPGSAEGRSWLEVVGERLDRIGYSLSPGHLRKLRRVHRFVEAEGGAAQGDLSRASLLALETAQRLFALDAEEGRRALADCLDGASAAEIGRRLKAVQARSPERLSARQVGWRRRQEAAAAPSPLDAIVATLKVDPRTWWEAQAGWTELFVPGDHISLLKRTPRGIRFSGGDRVGLGGLRMVEAADDPLWLVESVLVQASFFDRYWLAGRLERPRLVAISILLTEFSAHNVGVFRWTGTAAEVVRGVAKNVGGARREMLAEALGMAAWDERRTRPRR